jgi:hypothetical protein
MDSCPQVGARPCKVPDLDNPVVHVSDVDRPVGSRGDIDRSEVRIERLDELAVWIRVVKIGETFFFLGMNSPDDAADRFTVEVFTYQILGQPVPAVNVIPRASGHALQ